MIMGKYITVYRFALLDEGGEWIMTTEMDVPSPVGDGEFWERFMQGDVRMQYVGWGKEVW
jgi:hypothetical protein